MNKDSNLTQEPTECPRCGGDLYDNRSKKASGQFKGKSPDFACKEKQDCGWAGWLPRDKANGNGASGGRSEGRTHIGSWTALDATYTACVKVAKHSFEAAGVALPPESLVSAANGLMIAAEKAGLTMGGPKKKAAPPPKPEPEPEPEMPEDDDSDLPF